jgi:dTDP-L-rhamnose 4-epimerase
VLVTGGAGFIGRRVVDELLERGHRVRVLDSLRPDVHRDDAAAVALARRTELLVGDVRDEATLDRALADIGVVVHLAAKVGLGAGLSDLPDYASSNDYGTACLLAALARAGVGRLVLASSMVVYGEGLGRCAEHGPVRPQSRPLRWLTAGQFEPPCPVCRSPLSPMLVDEDASPDPRNAYAASKLAQEHLAAVWARSVGGSATVLRYHNVYGPGLPVHTPYAGVAALWLSELRTGRAPRVFEDGAQRRDFVHVDDVAVATASAVEASDHPAARAAVRAFNVGSGSVRTVGEMASALSAAFGGPAPIVTGEYRLGDVRHITADSTRLREELGVSASVALEDGIASMIAESVGHGCASVDVS